MHSQRQHFKGQAKFWAALFPQGFGFPKTLFAGDNPVPACRAFQQQNDAVLSVPPLCLSHHLQNLANASGFACFVFFTYVRGDCTRSLQQPGHLFLWRCCSFGWQRAHSASAFCLWPQLSSHNKFLCFLDKVEKQRKRIFGMPARQFYKYVLALTSPPSYQQAELSEDQTKADPEQFHWNPCECRSSTHLSLLWLLGLYQDSVFLLKSIIPSAVTFPCSHPKPQPVTPASEYPTLKFPSQSPFMFYILMYHVYLLPFSSIWVLPLIVNCINQLTKELLQSFSLRHQYYVVD